MVLRFLRTPTLLLLQLPLPVICFFLAKKTRIVPSAHCKKTFLGMRAPGLIRLLDVTQGLPPSRMFPVYLVSVSTVPLRVLCSPRLLTGVIRCLTLACLVLSRLVRGVGGCLAAVRCRCLSVVGGARLGVAAPNIRLLIRVLVCLTCVWTTLCNNATLRAYEGELRHISSLPDLGRQCSFAIRCFLCAFEYIVPYV